VTRIPPQLRGERPLAEYFESMGMAVESVTVVREVGGLKRLLDERTKALLELEGKWTEYVGNPSVVEEYDPMALVGDEGGSTLRGGRGGGHGGGEEDVENGDRMAGERPRGRFVVPHRPRPTIRPGWFKPKVDALEWLEERFRKADELVKRKRRLGKFRSTGAAFVTFEKMSSAVCFFSFETKPLLMIYLAKGGSGCLFA